MSDINQDDIDKLLQDTLVGDGQGTAPTPAPIPEEEDRGPASQDDIDALFAAVGSDPEPAAEPAPKPAPEPEPAPEPPAADDNLDGVASQDDIDALFSAVGDIGADEEAPEPAAPVAEADDEDDSLEGVADQSDIDALFADVDSAPAATANADTQDEPAPEPPGEDAMPPTPAADGAPQAVTPDDIGEILESALAGDEGEEAVDPDGVDSDLEELLSSIADENAKLGQDAQSEIETVAHDQQSDETAKVDTVDMDELLRQVNQAAPPPPPAVLPAPRSPDAAPDLAADTAILDMSPPDISQALAQVGHVVPPPRPSIAPPPSAPPAAGARKEFSVLYGAGEVESVANQIASLLSAMSEKANGYMQAWIAADSEARELRTRALAEERRRSSLDSEKAVLGRELDELRARLGEAEGAKVAGEEAKRALETTHQAKLRELESRISLLTSEAETLKNELTGARNQATGIDIESRRTRFELDRLKNEVESERMERLRIQRALENREKELQALQSQTAGQASSLFIDELHRLVRRLESELDARSSGAHEALKQLDRLETSESMVPVVANLRASLMQAMGVDDDQDDALKSLGREAAGVRGGQAVAPGKAEIVSFETALATYNLDGALETAGALLREVKATPALLMRKIYQCPALRRPEVGTYLGDLSRLLEGLRTVQEAADRSRGSETGESEVFHVQMFDFLHNLVRLKLISRLSGDIWRLFLDLRGRFSFVTSDKQWAEYRDQTLNTKI